MLVKLLISIVFYYIANTCYGQITLKNPMICHDKNNFLNCYNDGTYLIKFKNGELINLETIDSSVFYFNNHKKLVIIQKYQGDTKIKDTLTFILLSKSILIQRGQTILEINSLSSIDKKIYELGIGTISSENKINRLFYNLETKDIEIQISTSWENWSWDIKMKQNNEKLSIVYNGFKKNRLQNIFTQSDSLKHGMILSTTFNNLKKVSQLESVYFDSVGVTSSGITIIGDLPLEKYYNYSYTKKGKLKRKKVVGEMKLCD